MTFSLKRFIARGMLDAGDARIRYAPPPSHQRPHPPHIALALIHREELWSMGKKYALVSYNDGPVEIYRVLPDGGEHFIGYSKDLLRNLNRGLGR